MKVFRFSESIVHELVDSGADANIVNNNVRTAFDITENESIRDMLRDRTVSHHEMSTYVSVEVRSWRSSFQSHSLRSYIHTQKGRLPDLLQCHVSSTMDERVNELMRVVAENDVESVGRLLAWNEDDFVAVELRCHPLCECENCGPLAAVCILCILCSP